MNVQDSIGYRQLVKSAKAGNIDSISKLFSLYSLGLYGFPIDEDEAEKWRKKALSLGYPIIPKEDFIIHKFVLPKLKRQITEEELASKLQYYEQEAGKANITASVVVARILEYGVIFPQRRNDAIKYWEIAASLGCGEAQFIMYKAYNEGKVYPKNDGEAERWFNLSVENNYAPAVAEKRKKSYAIKAPKESGKKFCKVRMKKEAYKCNSYKDAVAFICSDNTQIDQKNEIYAILDTERKLLVFSRAISSRDGVEMDLLVMDSEKIYGVVFDYMRNPPFGLNTKRRLEPGIGITIDEDFVINDYDFSDDHNGYSKAIEIAAEATFLLLGHNEVYASNKKMDYASHIFIPEDFGLVKTEKGYEYKES